MMGVFDNKVFLDSVFLCDETPPAIITQASGLRRKHLREQSNQIKAANEQRTKDRAANRQRLERGIQNALVATPLSSEGVQSADIAVSEMENVATTMLYPHEPTIVEIPPSRGNAAILAYAAYFM